MQKLCKCALVFFIILISCRTNTIIPSKDMVSLLVKIHLTEATLNNDFHSHNYINKDTIDYLIKTIESLGYTQAQFDSSMKYYTRNPKQLDAIYDKVIIELSKIETKIIAENKMYEDSIAKVTLKNLWNLKPAWDLPADGPKSTVDFCIPTVGLGVYTISADISIEPDDETINPSMVAYFFFDDKSPEGNRSVLTSKSYNKTNKVQNYLMILELRNSLVTYLKGSLFSHGNTDKNIKEHATITNIQVTYKPLKKYRKTQVKGIEE
jgi:hypothetical protein